MMIGAGGENDGFIDNCNLQASASTCDLHIIVFQAYYSQTCCIEEKFTKYREIHITKSRPLCSRHTTVWIHSLYT